MSQELTPELHMSDGFQSWHDIENEIITVNIFERGVSLDFTYSDFRKFFDNICETVDSLPHGTLSDHECSMCRDEEEMQ